MIESIILGAVQGVAEWLPISSEAMIVLVKNNFFFSNASLSEHIREAIFLHLGTLLAALVFFRKKIFLLLKQFFMYSSLNTYNKSYLNFIIITTLISGVFGYFLLNIVEHYEYLFVHQLSLNIFVALFLMLTAIFLYMAEQSKKNKT